MCDKESPWPSPKECTLSIFTLYKYLFPVKAAGCVVKLDDASLSAVRAPSVSRAQQAGARQKQTTAQARRRADLINERPGESPSSCSASRT